MSATYQVTPGDRTGETQSKSLPYWTLDSGGRQTVNSSSSERHRGAVTHRDAPRPGRGAGRQAEALRCKGGTIAHTWEAARGARAGWRLGGWTMGRPLRTWAFSLNKVESHWRVLLFPEERKKDEEGEISLPL